jgi:hypothetical protein
MRLGAIGSLRLRFGGMLGQRRGTTGGQCIHDAVPYSGLPRRLQTANDPFYDFGER